MELALLAYGALVLVLVYGVCWRYRSIVNPIAYFAAFYALQTLIAPLVLSGDASDAAQVQTVGYSALYFAAIAAPFLVRFSPLLRPLILVKNTLLPREARSGLVTYVLLACEFAVLFAILIVLSHTTEWLTSPRTAYQLSRAGVGVWWALAQGAIMTGFLAYLLHGKRTLPGVLAGCIIASACAYFLASKSYMLFPFVLAIFYYEHTVKPIPRWMILAAVGAVLCGISALQLLQGTAENISDTIAYFDYFGNTAQFLDDFAGRFHHTWGATWLSSFWDYVPRALYPEKPYAYGIGAIMEQFTPGAAEAGSTAGILPWAGAYLDFGWAGIVLDGLVTGFIAKAVFELIRKRPSVTTFLLFAQLGLQTAQPVYSAPLPLFWVWLIVQLLVIHAAGSMRNEAMRFLRQRDLTVHARPRST